jgi:rod shape determining protein RodA
MQYPVNTPLTRLAEVNWFIVLVACTIAGIGLVMMYSAGGGENTIYLSQQFGRFALAFAVMICIALLPMRLLMDYAYVVYGVCLFALIVVDIIGHIGMGAQRWIKLGGATLQPSEFMKLAVVLALSRYFHRLHPEDIRRATFLIVPALIVALPAIFIYRQPSLGGTIITLGLGVIMCFLAGVQWRYFLGAGVVGVASAPLLWHFMHEFQRKRVLTFLDPQKDPLGAGYNVLQSMIAVGSGGFLGKGYLQGSQSQLNFLPEKHTDFIFTMLSEEFGFLGSMLLLGLYAVLLASGLMVAVRSRSTFGAMLAAGVVALLFVHIFINCGMVMGLLPVVGVPLPLMSYGGSFMLSSMCAIGLLLNACAHCDEQPSSRTPRL